MDPIILAQLIEALASIVTKGMDLYTQGQATMSATDAQAVHAALLKVEAATATLRPQVDAALDAASKT